MPFTKHIDSLGYGSLIQFSTNGYKKPLYNVKCTVHYLRLFASDHKFVEYHLKWHGSNGVDTTLGGGNGLICINHNRSKRHHIKHY